MRSRLVSDLDSFLAATFYNPPIIRFKRLVRPPTLAKTFRMKRKAQAAQQTPPPAQPPPSPPVPPPQPPPQVTVNIPPTPEAPQPQVPTWSPATPQQPAITPIPPNSTTIAPPQPEEAVKGLYWAKAARRKTPRTIAFAINDLMDAVIQAADGLDEEENDVKPFRKLEKRVYQAALKGDVAAAIKAGNDFVFLWEDEDIERSVSYVRGLPSDYLRKLENAIKNLYRIQTLSTTTAWNNGTVVQIARKIRAALIPFLATRGSWQDDPGAVEQVRTALVDCPLLADALEEAGCENQQILAGLREEGNLPFKIKLVRQLASLTTKSLRKSQPLKEEAPEGELPDDTQDVQEEQTEPEDQNKEGTFHKQSSLVAKLFQGDAEFKKSLEERWAEDFGGGGATPIPDDLGLPEGDPVTVGATPVPEFLSRHTAPPGGEGDTGGTPHFEHPVTVYRAVNVGGEKGGNLLKAAKSSEDNNKPFAWPTPLAASPDPSIALKWACPGSSILLRIKMERGYVNQTAESSYTVSQPKGTQFQVNGVTQNMLLDASGESMYKGYVIDLEEANNEEPTPQQIPKEGRSGRRHARGAGGTTPPA